MRVLFLSAASSIHTVRWVNALSTLGHKVTLVSQKDHKAVKNSISRKVEVIYLPFDGSKGYYLNAGALKRIYKKDTFDVINVHYASGYGTLARIARLPNILLSVWGSDVYDFPYESKIKEIILRKNLKYASAIASTSNCMAKQTRKFVEKNKKIFVTPFGVDIDRFCPDETRRQPDKFVFGIVKTLAPKYGIDTVIRAFALFLNGLQMSEKEKTELRIYGTGSQLEELKKLTKFYGIDKRVLFEGYIQNCNVPQVLNQMDVFLLGSKLESFGVAAVEAMACGLPVIATNADGFKEVIEDKTTGFLVSIGDAEMMSQYMNELYKNEQLRKEVGRNGRQKAEQLYDWKKNVRNMIELYETMI